MAKIYTCFTVDAAVETAHEAVFGNQGQSCCAASRAFVHEKVYDEFVEKAVKMAEARKMGNPMDQNTQHGPQVTTDLESVFNIF